MLGESFSASGSLSLASAVGVVRDGIIPSTAGYEEQDTECDLDYVPGSARRGEVKTVLVTATDPYGQNSAVIIGRHVEDT
jgi:3-oxoacyl-(acyl-carrier-protein) synthase